MIFHLLPRFPTQILWFERCGDFSFVAKVSHQILWFERCGDFICCQGFPLRYCGLRSVVIFHLLPRFPLRYCGLRGVVIFHLLPRFPSQILCYEKCFVFFVFYCIFVSFPLGILGQVWYLIISFPDLCRLSYSEKYVDFFSVFMFFVSDVMK